MSKAEDIFRQAYERLKSNTPINLPKGTRVTQSNVAKEAGKHPTALKKDRFPVLVLKIQDYIRKQEIDHDVDNKKKELRKQRMIKEKYADSKIERDRLISIIECQKKLIDDLRDENNDLRNGLNRPINMSK
jgi:hypothetical protein